MRTTTLMVLPFMFLGACGDGAPFDVLSTKDPFTSDIATLMVFEFDGELLSSEAYRPTRTIESQLLYTIGQLNGNRSVGRLDAVALSNVSVSEESGRFRIRYHASLPVAWGSKTDLPTHYELILPIDLDYAATQKFTEKYGASCADPSAHDLEAGNYWYYYRPSRRNCQLDAADVLRTVAQASVSAENTNGKYPEYDQVWSDNELVVVSIFGKYEDGATTDDDAGIDAYNTFVAALRSAFREGVMTPADVPARAGVAFPDVTIEATVADGRRVKVHALLVDNVRTAGLAFDARYSELSTEADLIAYNGHAGLGSNVRALARKGSFRAGKYQIIFMNGCDTFAYVDGALAATRSALNPDDPTGTRYMDIITNARPSYFVSNSRADMALIRGLLAYDAPRTYQSIFRDFDPMQVVVVTGEEDNVFEPEIAGWTGLEAEGVVARNEEQRFTTPVLTVGRYSFVLTGDGDADLYVRTGAMPTVASFDCRPYLSGSQERCEVSVSSPTTVHVMVRGYGASSRFTLTGRPN